jgi:hypothetical protein
VYYLTKKSKPQPSDASAGPRLLQLKNLYFAIETYNIDPMAAYLSYVLMRLIHLAKALPILPFFLHVTGCEQQASES